MPDGDPSLSEVYVMPGESHLVTERVILRTLLGSCVGVTFLIPRLSVGALCHPMLPVCPVKAGTKMSPASGRRYVDFAIRDLVRQFDAMGARREEVRVKLFGGADVLLATDAAIRPTVGQLNCETALRVLQEEGLNVLASSLGGRTGLNIHFDTATGEVLVQRHS